MTAVGVAAEDHALTVGFAAVVDFVSGFVGDGLAVFIAELLPRVAEVEVIFSVGTKVEGVDAVIVLAPGDAAEEHFAAVGFEVAIVIGQDKNLTAGGDDDTIPKDGDAMGGDDVLAFVKDGLAVGFAVLVSVFEDEDAVAGHAFSVVAAVVDDFADPDASEVVHINRGRAEQHGLGSEGFGF